MTAAELKIKYGTSVNILNIHGMLRAISKHWKTLINENKEYITNDRITRALTLKTTSRDFDIVKLKSKQIYINIIKNMHVTLRLLKTTTRDFDIGKLKSKQIYINIIKKYACYTKLYKQVAD